MKSIRKMALLALVPALGLVLGGCQTAGKSEPMVASTQGVTCDKCKVTYVKVAERGGKSRVVGYRTQKKMECPDCKSAAENFFATGKFEHTCKSCGDAVGICQAH